MVATHCTLACKRSRWPTKIQTRASEWGIKVMSVTLNVVCLFASDRPVLVQIKLQSQPEYCSLYDYITKHRSSQTGFMKMTMSSLYSNELHSPQISNQKSTFGTDHGCTVKKKKKISNRCVMRSWQHGPKSLRNVSSTLLTLCHKESRQFWRQHLGSYLLLASVPKKVGDECMFPVRLRACYQLDFYCTPGIFACSSFLNLTSGGRPFNPTYTNSY